MERTVHYDHLFQKYEFNIQKFVSVIHHINIIKNQGTSLEVQWLRLHTSNAGGPGSIPGQGTRSHMPQLRVRMLQQRSRMQQLRPGTDK